MKQTTKIARVEYKRLLDTLLTEIVERTGCSYLDLQNASSYFEFRKVRR